METYSLYTQEKKEVDKTIMKKYIVYEHLFPNGKRYIGITCKKPNARWEGGSGYTEQHQPVMYYAIKKYGWNNIEHNILYNNLTLDEAKKKEIELIKEKHTFIHDSKCNGYNMTLGGEGSSGHKNTSKVKEANRKRLLGKRGKNCPNSYPVICEGKEYESLTQFCEINCLGRGSVEKWLNGRSRMPKEWLEKNLRFKYQPDKRKKEAQPKSFRNIIIYCGKIYKSQRELSDFLGVATSTLSLWLNKKNSVPMEIFKNGFYKYDGTKYDLIEQKKPSIARIECEGKCFNNQRELAKYLDIKPATLNNYLIGKYKMPDYLIKKNIKIVYKDI